MPRAPRPSHAGCGGRVERTLTNTCASRRNACWMVPSPSQLTRAAASGWRKAWRGPTDAPRDASSRTT
jgi:hypothetical protein